MRPHPPNLAQPRRGAAPESFVTMQETTERVLRRHVPDVREQASRRAPAPRGRVERPSSGSARLGVAGRLLAGSSAGSLAIRIHEGGPRQLRVSIASPTSRYPFVFGVWADEASSLVTAIETALAQLGGTP